MRLTLRDGERPRLRLYLGVEPPVRCDGTALVLFQPRTPDHPDRVVVARLRDVAEIALEEDGGRV